MLFMNNKHNFLLLLVACTCCIFSVANTIKSVGRNGYEYILPQRKIVVCPGDGTAKFTCQKDHVISINRVLFTYGEYNNVGECTASKEYKCAEEADVLRYTQHACAGLEYCMLNADDLRTKTKCPYSQVISFNFKCVPTWEIMEVPIKCDICKNVTITNFRESYGFLHSAWYPKLYPRVTCHSLIKNKPNHFIIMYSVTGSLGHDIIQIESLNDYGQLISRELLTGDLKTKQVLMSPYDVNVTVLPEDTHFFEHRRFLLYFYLVPKKCIDFQCTHNYTTDDDHTNATAIMPLKHHHSKFSDAWLAAILALAYALLMLLAVLLALYCRKRRRKSRESRLTSVYSTKSSQIILPNAPSMSRGSSLRDLSYEQNRNNGYYITTPAPSYPNSADADRHERDSSFRRGFRSGPAYNTGYIDYEANMQAHDYHGNRFESVPNQRQSLRSSIKRSFSENSLSRGVEYTRSPVIERVRIRNLDNDNDQDDIGFSNSRNAPFRLNGIDNVVSQQSLSESRNFSARLYPDDGYDKEVQELSMYFNATNQKAN